jgi:hypothetical protein
MGSTKTVVEQPTPPAAPSTADAVQAYVQNMPAMYQAQLEWAPKIQEQELGMIQQYLPQLTALQQQLQQQYAPQQAAMQWQLQQQYAPLMAAQQQEMQRQYEPEAYAAMQNLGGMLTPEYLGGQGAFGTAQSPMLSQLGGIMTPEWMTGYSAQQAPGMEAARQRIIEQARDAWSARGLGESGMSALDEARMLSEFEFPYAMQQEALTQDVLGTRMGMGGNLATQQLQQQQNAWQNYYAELGRRQNLALSMAGRYNVPTQSAINAPQIGLPNYQAPNVMQGYNFGQVQNSMMQGYGDYSNLYGNMYGANAQMAMQNAQNPWMNVLGSIGGGIGGGIAGGWANNFFGG